MALRSLDLPALGDSATNNSERWFDCGPTTALSSDACASRFSGRQGPRFTYLGVCVEVKQPTEIRSLTFELYRELLTTMAALDVPRFVRIWNFVPEINAGDGDEERYRQFCWGRAEALGEISLPAATGIGSKDGWLRIGALCTGPAGLPNSVRVEHLENERQVSAYNYPRDYGPRSPSFARATLVRPPKQTESRRTEDEKALLLVSGTSSIVAHRTLHAGDLAAQTAETLRNIQALFKSLDADSDPEPLALRYYLRNAAHLARARTSWTANAGHWQSPAWYEADICRSDLTMEVEGVFKV